MGKVLDFVLLGDQEYRDYQRGRSICRPLEEGKQEWGESLGEERREDSAKGSKHTPTLSGSSPDPPISSKLPKEAQGSPASGPLLKPFPTPLKTPSFNASSQVSLSAVSPGSPS